MFSDMKNRLFVDADIRKAHTLPSDFYTDVAFYERAQEQIFAKTWQYVADADAIAAPRSYYPFFLQNEPLVLTRDRHDQAHCLSNVCTHRGKIIAEQPGQGRQLTCGYHGRCFDLDGTFKRMPGFENVENFPSPADHLPTVPFNEWMGLLFVGLEPKVAFEDMIGPIQERVGWLPLETLQFRPAYSKDYLVNAHWALYCDNYLEGFHVPFVHPGLNAALDFGNYEYHLFDYCNLQMGIAKPGEMAFELPASSPDYGKRVFGYYFWLFPNLMFNFYPWGLSLNIVEPLGINQTRVRFRTYTFEGATMDPGATGLHETELEDEAVVESVQLGVRSRYYKRGRFSPTMEKCVHHFHRLVAEWMYAPTPPKKVYGHGLNQ
jgi:choline monooxygenase